MGIKRNFSQDPIDYHKIRKSDKRKPPKSFYRKFHIVEKELLNTKITSIGSKKNNANPKKLILFIHGGAFISGPAQYHWDVSGKIVEKTDIPIWLVDYPKAPEYNIQQINQNIDSVYEAALQEAESNELILIGDSVGGNLIMTLVQRLIAQNQKLPSKLVLITPVLDASMTNKEIDNIDDPMLSKVGIVSAKKMCAKNLDLKNPIISPLYGSFKGFPSTIIFIGGRDIMAPDGLLASEKMKQAGVQLELIYKPEMPHVYPLLPVMVESKEALLHIVSRIS